MTQTVTRYHALYESLRSRRRRPETHRGLDSLAAHAAMKLKHRKVSLPWLRAEAQRIDTFEKSMRNHSERALDEVVRTLRESFVRGRQDDEAVRRSMAAIREIARRETA